MARDIEEFLKQAAQRRQEKLRQRQQQQPQQQQPQQPRPVQPQPPQIKPRPPQQRPQQRQVPQLPRDDIHIIQAQDASPGPLQERHVQSRINTRPIHQQAEHLAERIENADDVIDARIHKQFDHDVGNIRVGEKVADDVTFVDKTAGISPVAIELIKALKNPQSIRQAVLLTEILKRPEFD